METNLKNSCGTRFSWSFPLLGALLVLPAGCPACAQIQTSPEHPESLQQTISAAYRSGRKRITIPPGTYQIRPPASGPHLRFENFTDFVIDATGVELIFADQTRGGIEFQNCRHVTLLGASVRFAVPPFTQGVVEAVASGGDSYDLRIDRGYPTNFDDTKYFPPAPFGSLFDRKSRNFASGTIDLIEKSVERKGPDLFRVQRNPDAGRQAVSPGDLLFFRGSGTHNISLLDCANMRLDGVTVLNAAAFAVFESGGEGGNYYDRVTVKRGPRPPGARTDPLVSSTADAFHSFNVRRGPILENCRFESMGDDGIAIHGTFALVLQAEQNRLVVSKGFFRPGDLIRLLDVQDRPAGETSVKAVRPLERFPNAKRGHRDTRDDNSTGPYFELTLARPLPASFDYLASNSAASGSGYVLRNNTILNHRARGMILKADNGLVEANTIDGSTMGGIVLMPEFWWNESGLNHNVIIRGNTIRNVARAPRQLGAVVIAELDPTPIPGCGHRHIFIEGNRFEDINGVNVLIASACDVSVRNNRFVRPQQQAAEAGGAEWGEDSGVLIFVKEAQGVRLENNQTSDAGPFHRQ